MYGDIHLSNTQFSQPVKILGRGDISQSTFESDLTVYGVLHAHDSTFNANIYVTGSDLTLVNDEVKGDVHVTNYFSTPKVHLRGSSVSGRIIFHSLKLGEVYADGSSETSGVDHGAVK